MTPIEIDLKIKKLFESLDPNKYTCPCCYKQFDTYEEKSRHMEFVEGYENL